MQVELLLGPGACMWSAGPETVAFLTSLVYTPE